MIIALAGRRVDAPNSPTLRFPPENVYKVRERIENLFMEKEVTALVSAAACGADLIALTVASDLGLRRRIVLPFEKSKFRETSVADRPGDWGSIFDKVIAEVEAVGDLLILDDVGEDEKAYQATNVAILDEAKLLSASTLLSAVIVWDGTSRGQGDLTASFADEARLRAIPVDEILTLM